METFGIICLIILIATLILLLCGGIGFIIIVYILGNIFRPIVDFIEDLGRRR